MILVWVLVLVVCVVVPLIVWHNLMVPRILLAVTFWGMQVVLLLHMHALGRTVMAKVIESGGVAREVSEAIRMLKYAQWPAAIALLISGAGLFLLAVFQRNYRVRKANGQSRSENSAP